MIHKALYAHLSASAGISALVGTRIYPGMLPQSPTKPALVYTLVAQAPDYTLDSRESYNPLIQIDCFADTNVAAQGVADAVDAVLSGFTGTFGGGGNTVTVIECLRVGRQDIYEDETFEFRVVLEYRFRYK